MPPSSSTRRDFLKSLYAGAAALSLGRCALPPESRDSRKNVLFIAIDDLNDWTGCLGGHPDAGTPNLDRLVRRGVLFTRAYCAAPACNPSRAALMTGIRPSTSGVYHNNQPWRESEVLEKAITLPQHFMAHGYSAAGAGKIYHGGYPDPDSWNEYWPSKTDCKPPDPKPENAPLNGIPKAKHFDWGPLDFSVEEMGDWKVAEWIAKRLGMDREEPFFLACGLYRPHLPWYVPRKYFDLYPIEEITLPLVKEDDLDDVPPMGRKFAKPEGDHAKVLEHDQWRKAVQGYLASIRFVDDCLGRVIDALDAGPHRDDTIIVLWSDHGWHLGEKLHWRKFTLWEEAARNVLFFSAPGVTRSGGRCDRPVGLIDIYPTLIELCGLARRDELEGDSLLPLLENPAAERTRPALTTHGRGNHSLRSERWRYIRYEDGTEELYDHEGDELEWINLAEDPRYDSIKKDLARWLPGHDADDVPPKKTKNKKKGAGNKQNQGR